MILIAVDLPAPFGPSNPDDLARLNVEADAMQRANSCRNAFGNVFAHGITKHNCLSPLANTIGATH